MQRTSRDSKPSASVCRHHRAALTNSPGSEVIVCLPPQLLVRASGRLVGKARLVYRMLRYGEQYVDKGLKYYEEKYREHEIRSIQKKAKDLGLVVTLSNAA